MEQCRSCLVISVHTAKMCKEVKNKLKKREREREIGRDGRKTFELGMHTVFNASKANEWRMNRREKEIKSNRLWWNEWSRPHVHYSVTISSRCYFIDMDECIRTTRAEKKKKKMHLIVYCIQCLHPSCLWSLTHSLIFFFISWLLLLFNHNIYLRASIVCHAHTHTDTQIDPM